MLYVILNSDSVVQHIVQIKSRIKINANAIVKSIRSAKMVIVGISAQKVF